MGAVRPLGVVAVFIALGLAACGSEPPPAPAAATAAPVANPDPRGARRRVRVRHHQGRHRRQRVRLAHIAEKVRKLLQEDEVLWCEEYTPLGHTEYSAVITRNKGRRAGRGVQHPWKATVEKAGSADVAAVKEAAKGIQFAAPGGTVTIHNENQHVSKTVRIGTVREDGQIDEIWNSGAPVVPDPYLDSYEWAAGLRELAQ